MQEPKKIKLTNNPSHKDVNKIPMSNAIHLYDDYDYVMSIEIDPPTWQARFENNENHPKDNS